MGEGQWLASTFVIDERYLRAYPPFIIRMLARRPVPGKGRVTDPVTDRQISIDSGLTIRRVRDIAKQPSWDPIPVGDMRRFLSGCGVRLEKLWRERHFMKRSLGRSGGFSHLEKLPKRERLAVAEAYTHNKDEWFRSLAALKDEQTPSPDVHVDQGSTTPPPP